MLIVMLQIAFAKPMKIEPFPSITIRVGEHQLSVEVADEPHERKLGLMHRKELPDDQGMIFVYSSEKVRGFWMKNTHIPLSIAYVNKDGVIVHIADMQPHNLDSVPSIYPAQYALEVNQGWFEENHVRVGMNLEGLPISTEE